MEDAPDAKRRAQLLGPDDPAAAEVIEGADSARLLLLCDHASNTIPAGLGDLGLLSLDLRRHIAFDIGAAAVTRRLAAMLRAPAVLSGYSRLVVDCNRALDDETLIPPESDGTPVPGNAGLSAASREARLNACFWPYHHAVRARLDRFAVAGLAPAVVSIHSFTPRMDGFERPWHVGILWDDDPRLPLPLMEGLAGVDGIVVGDNEPYSARDPHGFTIQHHAIARGLPHVLIELRQNEIATESGVVKYAALLDRVLSPILADDTLYMSRSYR